ncbi:MAG: bifunctional phosphoglucose/phosphomannose isomerase [Armatimonadetes bacterium]|nr:bifunctional phosphoglucose/phosphomannose isomerase [Armatimonadota bacterium]
MPDRLDDPRFVLRNDPKGMMGLTEGFPEQCREALSLAESAALPGDCGGRRSVVVAGMGGSAAGGDFLRALFEEQASVPCIVCRDYVLPKFVSEDSLLFACSYSGNTEETLAATEEALSRGCAVIAITSGGRLAELAEANGFPAVHIPGGQPPRTALGYLFIPLVYAARTLGYLPEQPFADAFSLLEKCCADWAVSAELKHNPTKALASRLFGRVPVLYGLGPWQALVATRWKGQLNENAKVMAFANAFPELNHNEILGWTFSDRQNAHNWATVILEGGLESAKMQTRVAVTTDLIRDKSEVYRASARGERLLEQILTLTYFGDFVSLYLAALYGVDPENIDAINTLKRALSEAVTPPIRGTPR